MQPEQADAVRRCGGAAQPWAGEFPFNPDVTDRRVRRSASVCSVYERPPVVGAGQDLHVWLPDWLGYDERRVRA